MAQVRAVDNTAAQSGPLQDQAGLGGAAVSRLTLTDFRNYSHLRLEPTANAVVLCGPNGAGKTNVLEALSFLIPGRGLRSVKLGEIGRKAGAFNKPWAVAAEIGSQGVNQGGPIRLGTGLEANTGVRDKRIVHVDGEVVRSQAVLADHLSAQWLTPQMDRLFLDGASTRRRFLDRLVFGTDPAHAGRLNGYTHALRERSKLLREGRGDAAWLSALEDTLATKGVAIAAARLEAATHLSAEALRSSDPFPVAEVSITGSLEQWLVDQPALAVEDRVRGILERSRRTDGETGGAGGQTKLPHQTDLVVRYAAKDMAAEHCSTGEQKMLLTGLVLANARLVKAQRGVPPLLLLDEVAAHLDDVHRGALFEAVTALGGQAWYTGTDFDLFAPLKGRADFFAVADATVQPKD